MRLIFSLFFLLVLTNNLYAKPLTKAERQQARQLLSALGCRACHDFEQSGSTLAPSLNRIGLKLNAEQILQLLNLRPEKLGSEKKFMPSYQTTPRAQLTLLSRFLANRK